MGPYLGGKQMTFVNWKVPNFGSIQVEPLRFRYSPSTWKSQSRPETILVAENFHQALI